MIVFYESLSRIMDWKLITKQNNWSFATGNLRSTRVADERSEGLGHRKRAFLRYTFKSGESRAGMLRAEWPQRPGASKLGIKIPVGQQVSSKW